MSLQLMYITNDPEIAVIAQKNGVDRIWIDLETLGKEERQKGYDSVKSHHTIDDIRKIYPLLNSSELLVRVNPWNSNSEKEIDEVIEAGCDIIMLPMWKSVEEVKCFLAAVDNRVKTNLLLETKEAAECLDEILKLDGIDEIHIGLNDLHLSLGLTFMFELLANGVVESLCNKLRASSVTYGFGGIACLGQGLLPAENILYEHYRLGSSRVILSRSFFDASKCKDVEQADKFFEVNVARLRETEKHAATCDRKTLEENKALIAEKVNAVLKIISERK